MKREILFRGRRINTGAWELGFALMTEHNAYIVPYYNEIKEAQMMHSVEPETVGQFTGLFDKNKNKIFEGDIVKLDVMICPITFRDGAFQMIFRKEQGASVAIQDRLRRFEIIGNIHDNPELLTINKNEN
jgi:hypothetical protein